MGFDTSVKPFGGELEIFDVKDIEALGYTKVEAKNLHYKLSNGNKAVSVPSPMHIVLKNPLPLPVNPLAVPPVINDREDDENWDFFEN